MNSDVMNGRILIIASSNKGKIREFRELFVHLKLTLQEQPENLHIEETGESFSKNARLKALFVAKKTGQWALADDSGLSVDALGGAPGVMSARFATNDHDRINRVLKELNGHDNRRAHFTSAVCIASPEGELLLEVEGRCDGVIAFSPRGQNGFGYDPIFEVESTNLTFAEMDLVQKRALSHRGRAFALLEPRLKDLLSSDKAG